MSAASIDGVTTTRVDESRTAPPRHDDRPVVVDLFSGAGGLTLGFEAAGFRVAAAVEIDPIHAETHRKNFPECEVIQRDIQEVTGSDILEVAGLRPGEVFAVIGGPPCQGFSAMGKRQPNDPRNRLVLEFSRIVKELAPKYFVLENVRGFLFPANLPLLEELVSDVQGAGYDILRDIQVLDASQYGVPQQRKRAIVLGYQVGVEPPRYPAPGCISPPPLVQDAIDDLVALEVDPQFVVRDVATRSAAISEYVETLDRLFPRTTPTRFEQTEITGCLRPTHTDEVTRRFQQTVPGTREPISRYQRLEYGGLAPTIRAGTGVDRGSYMAARPIHPEFPRCITVREGARLHSFPDWFEFHPTRWHGFRQVGNSVPPLLARFVAESLLGTALNGE